MQDLSVNWKTYVADLPGVTAEKWVGRRHETGREYVLEMCVSVSEAKR